MSKPEEFASRLDTGAGRPVFVGASPRSGTTLLRTMLNQHPDLGMPEETKFLLGVWRRRDQWGDLNNETNKRHLINWIVTRNGSQFSNTGIPTNSAIEHLTLAPPTLGSVVGAVFELYAHMQASPRWGDKRPGYIRHLNAIRSLFPNAQIVNIVRDPRAAIASMCRLGWYGGSIVEATDLWIRSVGAGFRATSRLDDNTIYNLRYEDLVRDPATTVENLLGFLKLDPAPIDVMMGYHSTNDIPTNSYHSRIATPPDLSRITAWMSDLKAGEIAFIEEVTDKYMTHYGYRQSNSLAAVPVELLAALDTLERSRKSE